MIKNQLNLAWIWKFSVFASLFFISTTLSNAGTSISIGMMLVLTVYMYCKNNYNPPALSKDFLYPYIIFFFCYL